MQQSPSQMLAAKLHERGFSTVVPLPDRSTRGATFCVRKQCGIYVLHFSDGSHYIGQTTCLLRRLSQHLKTYTDIEGFSFKSVPKSELDAAEIEMIESFESVVDLRNIAHASSPPQCVDFEQLISKEQQQHWLFSSSRRACPERQPRSLPNRQKFAHRFSRLMEQPEFQLKMFPVLRRYVQHCLIEPGATAGVYWGCSCLPGGAPHRERVYSRVNVYWQEVFSLGLLDGGEAFYSWHCALSVLHTSINHQALKHFPRTKVYAHHYASGGADQVNIQTNCHKTANALLHDPKMLQAIKVFNLRNMSRGRVAYWSSHCAPLAEALLTEG